MTANAATLDDFMALNDELAALIAADVPLDLGLAGRRGDPAAELEAINAAVARRVSRGETLEQALAREESLPTPYRCVVQLGLRSGQLDAALDGAQRLAQNAETSRYGVRAALAYPLIVCALAYVGLIGLCLAFVPRLESAHQEMRVTAGTGMQILVSLRHTLPYWVAIPPVLLLLLLFWPRGSSRSAGPRSTGVVSRWTGRAHALALDRLANFADALAVLLESQTPLAEALPLAACSVGDPGLSQAARHLAATLDAAPPPTILRAADRTDAVRAARTLPPFMRWALLEAEPDIPRPRALHMAASVYREAAQRASQRVQFLTPIIACVLIGGTVTLLYSLAVFAPVIDLLYKLGANPPGR